MGHYLKRTYHDFRKKNVKNYYFCCYLERTLSGCETPRLEFFTLAFNRSWSERDQRIKTDRSRASHDSNLEPYLIAAHGSLNLNLNIGVTIPNNFQEKLIMLIDKNPNLDLDDHFYDDNYDEDYFHVYWNIWN